MSKKNKIVAVERIKIGDTAFYRAGMSTSANTLPMGIANCKVLERGETITGAMTVWRIELPEPFKSYYPHDETFWVPEGDLEV